MNSSVMCADRGRSWGPPVMSGTKRCQTILCFSFWPGGKHELAETSRTGDDALLKPLLSKLALFGSSARNLQCPWLVRLPSKTLRECGHPHSWASHTPQINVAVCPTLNTCLSR